MYSHAQCRIIQQYYFVCMCILIIEQNKIASTAYVIVLYLRTATVPQLFTMDALRCRLSGRAGSLHVLILSVSLQLYLATGKQQCRMKNGSIQLLLHLYCSCIVSYNIIMLYIITTGKQRAFFSFVSVPCYSVPYS